VSHHAWLPIIFKLFKNLNLGIQKVACKGRVLDIDHEITCTSHSQTEDLQAQPSSRVSKALSCLDSR
jgi:hypothetical protein